MKRVLFGIVVATVLMTGGLAATLFVPSFGSASFVDATLSHPCTALRSATPVAKADGTVTAFVFVCEDGQAWVRTYAPAELTWIPGPENNTAPAASCPGGAPMPGWICKNGGWLPANHPLAK